MNNTLKVISYNCQSFNANSAIIKDILSTCDILCLQETLIDENNCQIIDKLDNNFMSAYVSAYRKDGNFVGRASGGLVIFWKAIENIEFLPINFDKRIMGLKLSFSNDRNILLLNIYMPCDYGTYDSLLEYRASLAKMLNICETEQFDDLIILGDGNADPNKGRFYRDLANFCSDSSLSIFDVENLPVDSYTYVSQNEACSSSWIDHICTSNINLIGNPMIMYGQTFYDHIPISIDLFVPFPVSLARDNFILPSVSKINWDDLNDYDIYLYSSVLDELSLEIFYDVFNCSASNCKNRGHCHSLEELYVNLIECMELAANFLPTKTVGHNGNRIVGWNTHCKELYRVARVKYLDWHEGGRIRMGVKFEEMKNSRKAFRRALHYCRKNKSRIKRENILEKFSLSNKAKFWKEISKINGTNRNMISNVDGKSNLEEITALFDNKYKMILDDPLCQNGANREMSQSGIMHENISVLTLDSLDNAIIELNIGLGWDGIHANHFKFAGRVFRNLFAKFCNSLLSHSFVPKTMIQGQIRPVLKSKVMGKTDSNNYRPVMNSSMSLKILEYLILPFLQKSLKLSNCQFGFRQNTSCTSAISVAKETIMRYNYENSNVHAALVDCSKAFDKINKNFLFEMMEKTDLDKAIVRIIRCMYENTYVNTKFNGKSSELWKTGNGVRQGGVCSALIFSYYINHVLEEISNMPMGCSLFGYKTGIICYADDILLLSPSVRGLQFMLNRLSFLLKNICLTVNPLKSNYIVFKHAKFKGNSAAAVFLDDVQLVQVDKCKYLGVMLSENGDLGHDIDRVINDFLKQFYAMYGKFNFCDRNVLCYLFRSYTSSFYGIELWVERMKVFQLDKISVAYHKAVKKVCCMNTWESNHVACEIVGVHIFKHLLAKRWVSLWHKLCWSISPCLANLKYYFKNYGLITARIVNLIAEKYNVDIVQNPACAVFSRINFVEKHEPRSNYVYVDVH